uniref:Fem-2 n=1 Tax=Hydra vulgaris TaxID=6087 RepID=A0A5P9Q5M3_HYDVU|nr:Fem-2 [Hydra vulgaris]
MLLYVVLTLFYLRTTIADVGANGIPLSCNGSRPSVRINGILVRNQACDVNSVRNFIGCNKEMLQDSILRACPPSVACYPVFDFIFEILSKAIEDTHLRKLFLKYSEQAAKMIFDIRGNE